MDELKDTILRLGRDENPDLNGSLKYLYALIASLPIEEAEQEEDRGQHPGSVSKTPEDF